MIGSTAARRFISRRSGNSSAIRSNVSTPMPVTAATTRNDGCQRMAIIGIARQRLRMDDELTALAVLEGGGNADLDAELVRLVRLALADALHLGCVQAVDLGTALSALLSAHTPSQAQQEGKFGFETGIAVDLAGNAP